MIPKQKNENLHIRVTPEQKALLVKAAKITGLDTSAFILQHCLREARKELRTIERITLSSTDSATFLNALAQPPALNDNLQSAYNDYKDIFNQDRP